MKANQLVSVALLVELTGYSESKIYRLAKQGVIKRRGSRTKESGFPLDASIQALLKHAGGEEAEAPEPAPSIKDQIEAEKLAEIREAAALRRRELIPVGSLEEYARQVGEVVRQGLEAFPAMVHKRIPHLRGSEVNMIRAEAGKVADRIAEFDDAGAA